MQKKLMIILAILVLFGCAKKEELIQKDLIFTHSNSCQSFSTSTEITVTISKKDYVKENKDFFWKKALQEGLNKINRLILKQYLILQPVESNLHIESSLLKKIGQLNPIYDPYVTEYKQKFKIKFKLLPDITLAGRVVSLKENTYAIGENELCYINFFKNDIGLNELKNSYFFVGKFSPEQQIVNIIGMGKILQVITQKRNNSNKLLAEGEMLELQREVEVGDLIFLPIVTVEAINPPMLKANPLQSEVVVQPKLLPEPDLPKETK
ncbi:MAG: hypothetical protein Q9M37_03070 [Desulfonauticus sp.]|nr:hypothetical protein [Desulfonauticus sp.]